MHARLIYVYYTEMKSRAIEVSAILKESAGDNRLWKTSMHEAAGATKQRQISTQVWAGEWCHLSEPHLQSAAILSAPLPAPLHLWKCTFHHVGSPKSSYMIRTRHGVCNQPCTHLRATSPHDRNRVWLLYFELYVNTPLTPHPPVLAFPLLSSFNKIFCLCWMSETQLSHICQREMGGGVQSDKREVGKELHHRDDKTEEL